LRPVPVGLAGVLVFQAGGVIPYGRNPEASELQGVIKGSVNNQQKEYTG